MEAQDEQAQEADQVALLLKRQRQITRAIRRGSGEVGGRSFSSSGVHFHGSAGLSLLSIGAICICIMTLGIGAAWYSAGMRDLEKLRADLDVANAYITAHEKRINRLESPQ